MKKIEVDVAIIGAGSAGMSAYRAALAYTSSVLVIEDGPYGTTCARVGCMPSKLLIAAAEAAHAVNRLSGAASAFGVRAGPAQIDGHAVMQRVRDERDRFVGFVTEAVAQWPAEHRLRGRAKFLDDQRLQVDDHSVVTARRIVIATGASPNVPTAWREAVGDRLIVNDDVFAWDALPESVAVLGAGVIALELAQALHRLGVRTRLYGRSERLGPLSDPALQSLTRQIIGAELPLRLQAGEIGLTRDGDQVIVRAAGLEERFDWVLAATGRKPNLQGLGLENTRLPLDPQGVPVFDRRSGQIGVAPVFIAGDVSAELELLHEAADEGRIAGDNAGRFPDVRVHSRRTPLAIVFSDPQICIAGLSHAQLLSSGQAFETGAVSFEDQGRSRVMLKNQGALHLYADRNSGHLLGAEMIGPAAEHLGHLLAWAIQRGDSVQQMLDCPFYHPVIEEGLRTALRVLQRALHMGPPPVARCLDCGPGG